MKSKEAGTWLHAFPLHNLGMFISFLIHIGLRPGCDICWEYQCKCGETVDEKGRYLLSCSKSLGRYCRHNEVNYILKREP